MSGRHRRSHWRALILGFFIFRDGGGNFGNARCFSTVITFQSGNFGLSGFWFNLKTFWSAWWIFSSCLAWRFCGPQQNLVLGLPVLEAHALHRRGAFYGPYYILLMPFWAVLAANGIKPPGVTGQFVEASVKWNRRRHGRITVFLCLLPDLPWIACPPSIFPGKIWRPKSVCESPLVATVARTVARTELRFCRRVRSRNFCLRPSLAPRGSSHVSPDDSQSLAPEYQAKRFRIWTTPPH